MLPTFSLFEIKKSYSKIQKTLWNEEKIGQETKCLMWEKKFYYFRNAHLIYSTQVTITVNIHFTAHMTLSHH